MNKALIGRCFERCVDFTARGITCVNPYENDVPREKFNEIVIDAGVLVEKLKKYYGNIEFIVWTGSYTSSTSSDLLINGEMVELKYVEKEHNGTWASTAIGVINEKYGFKRPYSYYMKEYDVYSMLEDEIGKKNVNRANLSGPVSQADALKIKKEKPEFYKEYCKAEIEARKAFVYDVVEYLNFNEKMLDKFANDIATKRICNAKKTPDLLVEYVYTTRNINLITKDELINMLGDKKIKYNKDDCQFYIGKYRITFAWKNCTGLFNPVIEIHT